MALSSKVGITDIIITPEYTSALVHFNAKSIEKEAKTSLYLTENVFSME